MEKELGSNFSRTIKKGYDSRKLPLNFANILHPKCPLVPCVCYTNTCHYYSIASIIQ